MMALANGDMDLNCAAVCTLRRRQKHENKFATNNLKRFGRSTGFLPKWRKNLFSIFSNYKQMFFGVSTELS